MPRGWDNQLADEFTAQVYLRRKWRTSADDHELGNTNIHHQIIPQIDLALGSVYRHVSAGAVWRIGYNLPDDFGPGRLADTASATGASDHDYSFYGFIRATGRVVEHNIFLDGNNYKDSHGVDTNPLVGELQYGVAATIPYKTWDFSINYTQTYISEQFDGQDGSDSYGSAMISIGKDF